MLVAAALVVGWSRGRIALPRLDRAGVVAAAAAIGLVAWTGLSIWWSIAGDRSWDALANGIVLLAFGVVGLAAGVLPVRPLRSLALLLAVALGAVLVWALLGKAIPALGPDDVGSVARLKGSIGYWNALALLADAALGLGLWLLVSVGERFGRAGAAPCSLYAATIVILLTQSRAGPDRRGGRRRPGALALRSSRRGRAARTPRHRPRRSWSRGGRSRGLRSSRTARTRADRVSDGRLLGLLIVLGAVVVLALVALVPAERLVATRRRDVVRGLALPLRSSPWSARSASSRASGTRSRGRPTRSAARARS